METTKKDQNFGQQPQKKTEMPAGPRTTTRPEIDLPVKGGRADSDLSSTKPQPKKDERNDHERSTR